MGPNKSEKTYLKNKLKAKGLGQGSSDRALAKQSQGPQFNPKACQKLEEEKKKKPK
jgi:hypothetical protein